MTTNKVSLNFPIVASAKLAASMYAGNFGFLLSIGMLVLVPTSLMLIAKTLEAVPFLGLLLACLAVTFSFFQSLLVSLAIARLESDPANGWLELLNEAPTLFLRYCLSVVLILIPALVLMILVTLVGTWAEVSNSTVVGVLFMFTCVVAFLAVYAWFLRSAMFLFVQILEGATAWGSVKRSLELTQGHAKTIFLAFLFFVFISTVLLFPVTLAMKFLSITGPLGHILISVLTGLFSPWLYSYIYLMYRALVTAEQVPGITVYNNSEPPHDGGTGPLREM